MRFVFKICQILYLFLCKIGEICFFLFTKASFLFFGVFCRMIIGAQLLKMNIPFILMQAMMILMMVL
ncbi:hypothetical protein REPUB_Repub11eG0093500 [Reevesia pubescens]